MFLGILNTYTSISFDCRYFWVKLSDLEHLQIKKTTIKFLIYEKIETTIEKVQNGDQNEVGHENP